MTKVLLLGFFALSALIVSGCAAIMPASGSVSPGILLNTTIVPGQLTIDQIYAAYPDSFEVLGLVEGSSNASNVLGLVSFGDSSYRKAIENAKAKADADGLINCVADIQASSFLVLFSTSKTVVRGLAIKRK